MSYYFQQQQMQRLAKGMGVAAFDRANAQRVWDESKIVRGKTTPQSRGGSFAPRGTVPKVLNAGNREFLRTLEAKYLGNFESRLRNQISVYGGSWSKDTLKAALRREVDAELGPWYTDIADKMADKVWATKDRNAKLWRQGMAYEYGVAL